MLSTQDEIAVKSFLKISKDLIRRKKRYIEPRTYDINRKKVNYKQAIIDIGIINKEDIWKYILELKEEDCFDVSFDRDTRRDTNSEIFEFKKEINKKNVYIKLTYRETNQGLVVCLSFHEDSKERRK